MFLADHFEGLIVNLALVYFAQILKNYQLDA